ncbi:hypothetical protein ACJ72_04003 [Emergomyces africanus]|uniref:Uncharacterized protein n=1 Tax=Emergomyces africanus TaxID=1955775 RepID=A0A1B7NY14_9EURO|nr:hypothetical protein ACJ72_04003 [Emergomyces africanus]
MSAAWVGGGRQATHPHSDLVGARGMGELYHKDATFETGGDVDISHSSSRALVPSMSNPASASHACSGNSFSRLTFYAFVPQMEKGLPPQMISSLKVSVLDRSRISHAHEFEMPQLYRLIQIDHRQFSSTNVRDGGSAGFIPPRITISDLRGVMELRFEFWFV